MTNQEYKELSPELREQLKGRDVWSIESMSGHEAAGRTVEYVGSTKLGGHLLRDYYRDNTGAWWYGNRAMVDGTVMSMEAYIFGKEITKGRARKWSS